VGLVKFFLLAFKCGSPQDGVHDAFFQFVCCCMLLFVDLIKLISICHSSAMSKMAVVFCESRGGVVC
jgi:hypothetical protein